MSSKVTLYLYLCKGQDYLIRGLSLFKASEIPMVKTPLERAIQKNYTSLTKSVEPELIVGRVFELDLIDNDQLEEIQLKSGKNDRLRYIKQLYSLLNLVHDRFNA